MEAVNKLEYRVRDLPTRSVTLFPTRAQVVRDIKDVPLKPGANQITIVGLTPTVDEHSIKVEGTGAAIITDISVELLPNREIFEDIYPDSDDDKSESDSESESDDDDDKQDTPELKAVRKKLQALRDEQRRAKEIVLSSESRLKILDAYGKMLDRKRGVEIDDGLEKYRTERQKVFQDHMDGSVRDREIQEEILELFKEEHKLEKARQKEELKLEKVKAKQRKIKEKEKEKLRRREAEKQKEKKRIRKERENFWARQCYTLRISLDATGGNNNFTPSSSRRSSIAGDIIKPVVEKEAAVAAAGQAPSSEDGGSNSQQLPTCDLSLTYVTASAFWAPSYDLALSTTANTGQLCFDAQLTNMTCESWNACKVILSTSQTTFSGLKDAIPTLTPWRVKLAPRGVTYHDVLNSREERAQKDGWDAQQQNVWAAQKPRNQLFGVSAMTEDALRSKGGANMFSNSYAAPAPPMAKSKKMSAPPMQQLQQQAVQSVGGLFGASSNTAAFGAASSNNYISHGPPMAEMNAMLAAPAAPVPGGRGGGGSRGLFRSRTAASRSADRRAEGGAAGGDGSGDGSEDEDADEDGATILPEPTPELSFQESSFEETGLTTTYDLPGLKNLPPSSTPSKQRVARVSFASVAFSHTVVAKYKPAAFLKVKVRNASKLTLLKGPVGLTLDSSFMGRSTLPRCSSGDSFTLSLGVDPAIRVAYPKPDVKRSTLGLFSKEDRSAYTRSVTLVNTRAGPSAKPVTVIVYDQAPVSEDEKLRVEIVQPRGMAVGGPGIAAGQPGRDAVKEDKDWGRAMAALRKAGEITWDVTLNPGRAVKLGLEYEVACPAGEHVMQC